MTQAAPARTKIPTETPQPLHSGLCERFAVPVIGAVTCQDITIGHMHQIVNAAPTSGEGDRVQGPQRAAVTAGAPRPVTGEEPRSAVDVGTAAWTIGAEGARY